MPWFYEHYKDASAIGINTTRLVHEENNELQSIKVFETEGHGRLLTLDDMVMVTELDEFAYHELLTHVPLCRHPAPKEILVVGGGDGGTVREALKHPTVERVVLCEIDERVTRVCQEHIPSVADQLDDPRVELVFSDAVAWVKGQSDRFDGVLVDSTEPHGASGAGAELFRRAFFGSLRQSMRAGGVLGAQTESPFYCADLVEQVFGEMRSVFSNVHGYYGLVPTYPGGGWTFCFASDEAAPAVKADRFDGMTTRYVNAEMARGCFDLPTFIGRLTGDAS
jgi:spermidine synthase